MARKCISVALQGGGALGAFTWGALDRLLEDDRIEIVAISGASAGAMNGVVLCQGLAAGGPKVARQCLRRFWEGIAEAGEGQALLKGLMSAWMPPWAEEIPNPLTGWLQAWASAFSPYEVNPLNVNPLREVLEGLVDFKAVRAPTAPRLYIAATNVLTGRVRIFTNAELTADHVLASACLPNLFQAVEIDGQPYWDGGYMGNPPLFPLFDIAETRDILIVQLNPIERKAAPRRAAEIAARVNEITFNASLLRELRAVEFVARLVREGAVDPERYREMLIHVLSDADAAELGADVKMRVDAEFFEQLFKGGRRACARWLKQNFDDLGGRSTVDLRAMFQGEVGPMGDGPAPAKATTPKSAPASKQRDPKA